MAQLLIHTRNDSVHNERPLTTYAHTEQLYISQEVKNVSHVVLMAFPQLFFLPQLLHHILLQIIIKY